MPAFKKKNRLPLKLWEVSLRIYIIYWSLCTTLQVGPKLMHKQMCAKSQRMHKIDECQMNFSTTVHKIYNNDQVFSPVFFLLKRKLEDAFLFWMVPVSLAFCSLNTGHSFQINHKKYWQLDRPMRSNSIVLLVKIRKKIEKNRHLHNTKKIDFWIISIKHPF